MKTKNYQPLTKIGLPDGEGFTALPITFNAVIARSAAFGGTTKQSHTGYHTMRDCFAPLAMTETQR